MLNVQTHIIELEYNVLGQIFLFPEKYNEAKAIFRNMDVFYNDDNKAIWECMITLSNTFNPIATQSVHYELFKKYQTNTSPFSGNTFGIVCTLPMMNAGSYAFQYSCFALVEMYINRESEKVLNDVKIESDHFLKSKKLNDLINSAFDFKIGEDWQDMSQLNAKLVQRLDDIKSGKEYGVPTGFTDFDLVTGGLQTGLHVWYARPGMGKTAAAVSTIMNMSEMNIPVGLMSLEMPDTQLASRIQAIKSNVPFWRIYRRKFESDQQEMDVLQRLADSATLPIYITDSTSVKNDQIRHYAEKAVRKYGIKALFIDYIQLIEIVSTNKNDNRQNEVQKLSRGLKILSKDLDIPIIALAQVNRESESSDKVSKRPKLGQLRESGALEQDADMGVCIDRPYKRGELFNDNNSSTEFTGILDIQKHRNGEEKVIEIVFNPETMRFYCPVHEANKHHAIKSKLDSTPF